jgi:hypothetical protein
MYSTRAAKNIFESKPEDGSKFVRQTEMTGRCRE